MEQFIWIILVTTLLMYVFRRFFMRNTVPITRQTIRTLFLQRLMATFPESHIDAGQEDRFTLQVDDLSCCINLDQLYLRCLESPSLLRQYIRQAVKSIENAFEDHDGLPEGWEKNIYPLLLPVNAPHPPDITIQQILPNLFIGYVLLAGDTFRFLTQNEITDAEIDMEHMHSVAIRNLERSCNQLVIDAPSMTDGENERLVRFITADGLDATRVLLPSFYQRFSSRFGETDLLVAIPSRDSLAIVGYEDRALASMLSWRSGHEYFHRAYALQPNLLLVNEHGLFYWPPA